MTWKIFSYTHTTLTPISVLTSLFLGVAKIPNLSCVSPFVWRLENQKAISKNTLLGPL